MKKIDALLVVNQYVDWEYSSKLIRKKPISSLVLLSSHYSFQFERDYIQSIFPNISIDFFCFGDFADDKALFDCDKKSYESQDLQKCDPIEFTKKFVEKKSYFKNQWLFEQLRKEYEFESIFCSAVQHYQFNLGISYSYWKEKNAAFLVPISFYWKKRLYHLLAQVTVLQPLLPKGKVPLDFLYLIEEDGVQYFFFSLKRLVFSSSTKITKISAPKQATINQIDELIQTNSSPNYKIFICTPLHQYAYHIYRMQELAYPILTFEDAFRPSNYPPYYFVYLFRKGAIVIRDMFDYELFSSNGKPSFRPLSFIKKNFFSLPEKLNNKELKTIILSLNHAGDWTALINRSDTDILIQAFVDLAKALPNQNCIIRLHPTMARYWNEGLDSKERIRKLVRHENLSNLSVSGVSLEEDWERGDLFITEYSLSVIDAMKRGKLGLFTNFTGRRTFMEDYVKLGIAYLDDPSLFIDRVKQMIDEPERYWKKQTEVVQHYNEHLSAFLNNSENISIEVDENIY